MGLSELFVPTFQTYTAMIDSDITQEKMDSCNERLTDSKTTFEKESDKLMATVPQMPKPLEILDQFIAKFDDIDIFYTKRSIGRPRKYLCTNHVKKDAIWKPLFRKFRRFIKEYISS